MKLKFIRSESENHSGYGAGSGSIDTNYYECPCGKAEVIYEKDNIPGFRDRQTWSTCPDCKVKYRFSKGTAELLN